MSETRDESNPYSSVSYLNLNSPSFSFLLKSKKEKYRQSSMSEFPKQDMLNPGDLDAPQQKSKGMSRSRQLEYLRRHLDKCRMIKERNEAHLMHLVSMHCQLKGNHSLALSKIESRKTALISDIKILSSEAVEQLNSDLAHKEIELNSVKDKIKKYLKDISEVIDEIEVSISCSDYSGNPSIKPEDINVKSLPENWVYFAKNYFSYKLTKENLIANVSIGRSSSQLTDKKFRVSRRSHSTLRSGKAILSQTMSSSNQSCLKICKHNQDAQVKLFKNLKDFTRLILEPSITSWEVLVQLKKTKTHALFRPKGCYLQVLRDQDQILPAKEVYLLKIV